MKSLNGYLRKHRRYSTNGKLELISERVASLRDEILRTLQFEQLEDCPFSDDPHPCQKTTLALSDRYGFTCRLVMCGHTGLLYLSDRLTSESYQKFYESGLYRKLISSYRGSPEQTQQELANQIEKEARVTANALVKALTKELKLAAGAKILDVGGSRGLIAQALQSEFDAQVTVLDPSKQELNEATKRGLQAHLGTLEQAVFKPDEMFDVVMIVQTIEHFFDIRQAFTKVRELVRPNGYVIFDTQDFVSETIRYGSTRAVSRLDHCYFLYDEMVEVFCNWIGLQIEKRIWYLKSSILYVCRLKEPDSSALFGDEPRLRTTRTLLNQNALTDETPKVLEYSVEERIYRKISSMFSNK